MYIGTRFSYHPVTPKKRSWSTQSLKLMEELYVISETEGFETEGHIDFNKSRCRNFATPYPLLQFLRLDPSPVQQVYRLSRCSRSLLDLYLFTRDTLYSQRQMERLQANNAQTSFYLEELDERGSSCVQHWYVFTASLSLVLFALFGIIKQVVKRQDCSQSAFICT